MPTQIIDNFDLNTAKPLDNRLVVGPNSFYTSKDLITYKYEGMRVWDLNDGVPYVWTGTTFSSENNVAVTGNGIENYLAKFGAASNVIGSSQIFDNVTSVGIATGTPDPNYKLHVNGKIYASGGFVGNGLQVTNLNATNINSGMMGIQYLQGGNLGWILTADNATTTSYKNPATINVGSANSLSITTSLWGQNFNGSQLTVYGTMTVKGELNRVVSLSLLSGGLDNSGTKTAKIQFESNSLDNKIITISKDIPVNSTLAFLEKSQTFTQNNTFSNRLFVGSVNSSSGKLVVGGSIETQNGGLYNNLYYGGSPADWRRSSSNPGYGFFYQTYNSENKYVFYTNTSGALNSTTAVNEVFKINPNSSKPQLEVVNGLKYKTTIAFSVGASTGQTYTHNLGYIPIAVVVCQDGNVHPNITILSNTEIRIYNYNTGGNTAIGTIYLW